MGLTVNAYMVEEEEEGEEEKEGGEEGDASCVLLSPSSAQPVSPEAENSFLTGAQ